MEFCKKRGKRKVSVTERGAQTNVNCHFGHVWWFEIIGPISLESAAFAQCSKGG